MTYAATPAPLSEAMPVAPSDPCWDARSLTGESGTATLILDGTAYQLRITRLGKLILTK